VVGHATPPLLYHAPTLSERLAHISSTICASASTPRRGGQGFFDPDLSPINLAGERGWVLRGAKASGKGKIPSWERSVQDTTWTG
jgi:hypothetical protein